jgi:hypothetical protein
MRAVCLLLSLTVVTGCHRLLPLAGPADAGGGAREGVDPVDGLAADGPVGCAALQPPPLLCEGFEDPWNPDALPYALGSFGADSDPPVRTTTARSGSHALETGNGASVGASQLVYQLSPAVTDGQIVVRAWLNVTYDPIPPGGNAWVILFHLAGELDAAPDSTKAGFDLGTPDLMHLHCPVKGWLSSGPGPSMAQSSWVCAELRVSLDAREASLWLDDTRFESCVVDASRLPTGGYTVARIGVGSNQSAARVLVDDVVIARGPVGCF